MERDISQKLIEWKNSKKHKPLLITGVRQCGKTYVIKQFGNKEFKNMVYLNFEENPNLNSVFEYDFNVKRILDEISLMCQSGIIAGETLLVFDEIQECPKAITSLKYFCENMPDLHVVCAGSLLGVAIKKKSIAFPVGKISRMKMYPMSFREFVKADGGERFIQALENWPLDRPLTEYYSVPMTSYLHAYYAVGGMPEAVYEWINSHDISQVETIQDEILDDYSDDFSKHAPLKEIEKIRWIWDSVPVQLAKENNKFVFSHVKQGKRANELEDALQWLQDAGLITKLELIEKIEYPLAYAADKTSFKVYMSDIGLLRRKSGLSYSVISGSNELFARYKGALAENFVLNELITLGQSPFFWRSGNTAELDFIIEKDDSVIPIEVKSADHTQAKSLKLFCQRYTPEYAFKVSLKNIAENIQNQTKIISLPLYMLWNMDRYIHGRSLPGA